PIQATPNHGIFAAHRADLATIRKIPAGELTPDHYLVVPKRAAGLNEVTVSTADWLSRFDIRPHAARARRMEPAQLAAQLRMDGTSGAIGAALGYHPAYVRKLRGQLARGALLPCDGPREVTLTAQNGRVRFLGERSNGVPESMPITTDFAWLLG